MHPGDYGGFASDHLDVVSGKVERGGGDRAPVLQLARDTPGRKRKKTRNKQPELSRLKMKDLLTRG